MVNIAKSAKHEPSDSATLKTMDTKQKRDVKQQALFMKTKVAPLSYLMGSMKIDGTLISMPIMQADVVFYVAKRFKQATGSKRSGYNKV